MTHRPETDQRPLGAAQHTILVINVGLAGIAALYTATGSVLVTAIGGGFTTVVVVARRNGHRT